MASQRLDREEYIEQAYFFRVYRERLEDSIPSQEILSVIYEEILATTRLPMAVEFLKGEILLTGRISDGMRRLAHYFAPFQAFVLEKAEEDDSRFDQLTALRILEREAEYRANSGSPPGLFAYQFECLARNRLGYDRGMQAIEGDPFYDENWKDWIRRVRRQLGTSEFSELIYRRSEFYVEELSRKRREAVEPKYPILFGLQEGRIAKANQGRDPLYMFAALQRQLGYPTVPRQQRSSDKPKLHPALEQRLQKLEMRLKILEMETKGELDISQFYVTGPDGEPKLPPGIDPPSTP